MLHANQTGCLFYALASAARGHCLNVSSAGLCRYGKVRASQYRPLQRMLEARGRVPLVCASVGGVAGIRWCTWRAWYSLDIWTTVCSCIWEYCTLQMLLRVTQSLIYGVHLGSNHVFNREKLDHRLQRFVLFIWLPM